MKRAEYEIVRTGDEWAVVESGKAVTTFDRHEKPMTFATQEAAFEAVYAAATNAIRDTYEVTIKVHSSAG